MAEEIRRSGRANKGHHTKNADALDEPALPAQKAKPKPKAEKKGQGQPQPSRSQSAQTPENDEEEEAIIRCVCGDQRDIRGRQMICCDQCEAWQHNQCLDLPEGNYWDNKSYYCEQCHPEDHVELLAAMERGEKPWNRKNKKKKAKSRPSDVKAEAKKEKPTPPPSQLSTPAPVPPPAQTSANTTPSAPAPITVPLAAPQDTSSGQAKPIKKDTPKSQPQSPLGEKRRHESAAEKDASSKKRRKSGAPPAEKPSTATGIEALPAKQKPAVEKLRDIIGTGIDSAAASRGYKIPDGESSASIATRFALEIYHALLTLGDPEKPDSPCAVQFRRILSNAKSNTILTDRLLSGSLSADELATMSAEEMASEEKQKEYAALREANEKQMVLTEETGPRLRKTHKGEEVVGGDEAPTHDEFRAPPRREREDENEGRSPQPQSPARDGHAEVELPEEIGQPAPIAVNTSAAPADGVRRPSTNFDINSVFDKVRSPQADQQGFLPRRQSSLRAQETPRQGPGDDADIDRLLKDEDNDVAMGEYKSDPDLVWRGRVQMQQMDTFEAVGRFVAGGDFGQVVPWESLLSSSLPIHGRVEGQKGDEWIRSLALSGNHDVSILQLVPTTAEGRTVLDAIYAYFHPRGRWGVIPVGENEVLRDLYLVPLEPGAGNLPPFLDMLEYCTIETPRKEPLVLLALVAKLPGTTAAPPQANAFEQNTPSAQGNHAVQPPNGPPNGPSPSPLANPHTPQYSPMNTAFPPNPAFHNGNNFLPPQPPPHNGHVQPYPQSQQGAQIPPAPWPVPPTPMAVDILGPYLNAPTIVKMLEVSQGGATMDESSLLNLRSIMEKVPDSRHDFEVFQRQVATLKGDGS
ncbi:hypothetical protein CC80DRAFT_95451 [Byssothecium circinans]|uniref:Transcription factor BYE1 n=1 Tax=Byssothecium circinans TaxID=147558 RepID=A0A6A5UEB8_9PLEO|nr:hypothetical protein CC80DRAFT_95451 [Byssothecium circinans]